MPTKAMMKPWYRSVSLAIMLALMGGTVLGPNPAQAEVVIANEIPNPGVPLALMGAGVGTYTGSKALKANREMRRLRDKEQFFRGQASSLGELSEDSLSLPDDVRAKLVENAKTATAQADHFDRAAKNLRGPGRFLGGVSLLSLIGSAFSVMKGQERRDHAIIQMLAEKLFESEDPDGSAPDTQVPFKGGRI